MRQDSDAGEGAERFRLLVESVVDYAIFMLDVDGHVVSWNAGAERIKGYAADEIIGQHFSLFYPPEDVAAGKCVAELEAAARDGRFEEEGWRIRKDGARFWANVVISAIRARDGSLLGFGQVTRDLTERRRAEEELARSEDRLRLLVASLKDYAIFVLDPAGHVMTWNAGAERLKGYAADEIIGQHFSRFYPEEEIRAGKCEMELEVAQDVGRFEDEGWRVRKDGSLFWANVVITRIQQADGKLVGFGKVTRDLTERKRHEEERVTLARTEEARRIAEENREIAQAAALQLRQARDLAEQSTRLKDEFLATVSHELRTPLNAILGWARMLQEGLPPEKTTKAIDTIVRNGVAQSQLIDDLLDVSRIIAGQLRLDLEMVDVNQIVTAAVDVVRPTAEAKAIAVHWSPNPGSGVIKADAGRLQQVLWNLLTNAVKFTPPEGKVAVTLVRKDGAVEIAVTDTGKGISADFLPRVFDRFSQSDSGHSRRTGGLGLGLTIVRHLVELHGGSVAVSSEGEGSGATFRVMLPRASTGVPRVETRVASPPLESVVYPPELRGLRVLVLDDEADARELVKEILERGGAVVSLASSAGDALTQIAAEQPHVIVSDIGMPGEDGHAFVAKLRALSPEDGGRIPAIALTAYARAQDRRKALVAGFQNHATKPVEPQELVMVVANLAGNAPGRPDAR